MVKTCSIDGCDKMVYTKENEYCREHYMNFRRYGNAVYVRIRVNPYLKFIEDNKECVVDDCIIWPYSKNKDGYGGLITVNGNRLLAHVAMLEKTQGQKPTPKHQAGHSCINPDCVNPRHLRWVTASEIYQARLVRGTSNRGERSGTAKLTEDNVHEIRTLLSRGLSNSKIADIFGVSDKTIWSIKTGTKWSWLKSTNSGESNENN